MMGFQKSDVMGLALVLFCTMFSVTSAVHLHIAESYMLDVSMINETTVNFTITAPQVTGWVGLGINENSEEMKGADLFIGGVFAEPKVTYGADYHVTESHSPVNDTVQDWHVIVGTEEKSITKLTIIRNLNTNDAGNDVVIANKDVNLLWSYNKDSDDVTKMHTSKGVCKLNLLKDDGGNCNMDSGATAISIGLSTLLMSLVAAILK